MEKNLTKAQKLNLALTMLLTYEEDVEIAQDRDSIKLGCKLPMNNENLILFLEKNIGLIWDEFYECWILF